MYTTRPFTNVSPVLVTPISPLLRPQQSNMKPTQVSCTPGSLNQLPPECTMQGDCRITPFYNVKAVMKQIDSYVAEINADPSILHSSAHGPHSKYTLPEEGKQGRIDLKWVGEGENGIACKLDSKGYHAILEATKAVLGSVTPYAIGGSLPLIRDLQDQGFDVQISGYGISSRSALLPTAHTLLTLTSVMLLYVMLLVPVLLHFYTPLLHHSCSPTASHLHCSTPTGTTLTTKPPLCPTSKTPRASSPPSFPSWNVELNTKS
jgi:hypothetical protein